MKKLIASGFVLTILMLGITPQISTFSTLITSTIKVNDTNNLQKWNLTPADIKYIEKYFSSKNEQEKQELEENLLSTIGLKNNEVTFDKQDKAHFNFIKNINLNPWFETYWYWFGYWRLHFNSNDIDSIVEGETTVTKIAEKIVEAAPYLGSIALVIAVWITANAAGLKAYDQGCGAWVAYFQIIPIPLGFGSN